MKLRVIAVAGLAAALWVAQPPARSAVHAQERTVQENGDVHVLPVQGNVYMLTGAGANVTVQVEDSGLVVVDTGEAAFAPKVIDAIKHLSTKPVRYIINTQFHEDHSGGNSAMSAAFGTPPLIAHENVSRRMAAAQPPRPRADIPTDVFFWPIRDLYNGEAIQIFYQPADTDGASFVHFRRADVVSAGDIFMTTTYPMIDLEAGGDVNKTIEGLNRIIDITVPVDKEEGGTLVVPGHGRIGDEADVVEYRDMVTIIRDRVQDAINSGSSLAQVKAAKLTFDFDGRYGFTAGPWTNDRFVEAVYTNLTATAVAAKSAAKPAPPANSRR